MTTRTCKVGIHGRNHEEWHELDLSVLRDAAAAFRWLSSQWPTP